MPYRTHQDSKCSPMTPQRLLAYTAVSRPPVIIFPLAVISLSLLRPWAVYVLFLPFSFHVAGVLRNGGTLLQSQLIRILLVLGLLQQNAL